VSADRVEVKRIKEAKTLNIIFLNFIIFPRININIIILFHNFWDLKRQN